MTHQPFSQRIGRQTWRFAATLLFLMAALPIAMLAQLPMLDQFVFNRQSWNLEVRDASGTSMEVVLSSMDGSARDSFLLAGYNLPVFTHEFSTRLCSLAGTTSDNDLEHARGIGQEQFLALYATSTGPGDGAPLAVTVFAREVVPTLNRDKYRAFCNNQSQQWNAEKQGARRYFKAHREDARLLERVSKAAGDKLSSKEVNWLLQDSVIGSRAAFRRGNSRVEFYLKKTANEGSGLRGYLKVDSIVMEVMDGSIRNLEVRGRQYLLPALYLVDGHVTTANKDNKLKPLMVETLEVLNDTTVEVNGLYRLAVDAQPNTFVNNFDGDSLIVQHPITYVAEYPIPVSSLRNFGTMNEVLLVNMAEPRNKWVLPLALTLRMVPELALNSDDYSPQNDLYTIFPRGQASTQPSARLYKEDSKTLFMAKIYTDLVGIQADEPNGLIQTELSKRVFLNPQADPTTWANYWEPRLNYTKVENKEKFLGLSLPDTTAGGDSTNTSILRTFQYSKFNFGSKLNIFRVDCPKYKFNFFVNSGAYVYQTAFTDTLVAIDTAGGSVRTPFSLNANTLSWESDVEINFLPDPRYGFGIQGTYRFMTMLSNRVYPESRSIVSAMIHGYFAPNPKSSNTIYFRGGIHFLPADPDQNFIQLQLGYAVNIIK